MAKIGEGHLAAMGRLGLRELRAATYPDGNVAQPSEYGLYGTQTPGEVAEARREGHELEEEKGSSRGSILDERVREAEARELSGRGDKDMGMDMER